MISSQELEGFWKFLHGAAEIGTELGVSVLLGYMMGSPLAAGALRSTSTLGNIYAQKVHGGDSKEQAANYAMLISLSQFGTQYLIGGISKLGGKLSNELYGSVVEKIFCIDDVYAQLAADVIGAGLNQGAVSAIQYCLQPVFEHWVFDTELSGEQFKGVVSAYLQGAFMGMFFEGIDILASGKVEYYKSLVNEAATAKYDYLVGCNTPGEALDRYEYFKASGKNTEAVGAELNRWLKNHATLEGLA